jgi:hypothetical protein
MAKEPEVHRYDVPVERLHQAVLDAVAQKGGWKLQSDDGPGGAVRFNTGMSIWSWSGQDMAAVTAADATGSTLSIGGSLPQRGMGKVQQVSWGEAGRVAKKVKQAVDAALAGGA